MKLEAILLSLLLPATVLAGGNKGFLGKFTLEETPYNITLVTDDAISSFHLPARFQCNIMDAPDDGFLSAINPKIKYKGEKFKTDQMAWHEKGCYSDLSPYANYIILAHSRAFNIWDMSTTPWRKIWYYNGQNISSVRWGVDNNVYFVDQSACYYIELDKSNVHTVNIAGNCPSMTKDKKRILASRLANGTFTVWGLDIASGQVQSYPSSLYGADFDLDPLNANGVFYTSGYGYGGSTICYLDIATGKSNIIVGDQEHGFSNVRVSRDGQWLVFTGVSRTPSKISNMYNADIFVCDRNGQHFQQITNHPADDFHPMWSYDGKHIYFYSGRASSYIKNKDNFWTSLTTFSAGSDPTEIKIWRCDFDKEKLKK